MSWLNAIKNPDSTVPAMVIGVPSDLRERLESYLRSNGFNPEVVDGHTQATASLNVHKRARTLPAVIISGYQCGSGSNAVNFLQNKNNNGVPFLAITNNADEVAALSHVDQQDALWLQGVEKCIDETELKTAITPNSPSPEAHSLLKQLETYRKAWQQKQNCPDLP